MTNAAEAPDPRIAALLDELEPDEQLLWHSFQHVRPTGKIPEIYLFAIPWTAFAVIWMALAFWLTGGTRIGDDPMAVLFPLFGLPFLMIGIGMLASPILRRISAKKTVYAVTDNRIIRLQKASAVLVQVVPPERIKSARCKPAKKQTGNPSPAAIGTVTVKLKGKASDYGPLGQRLIMRDVTQGEDAEQAINALALAAKN